MIAILWDLSIRILLGSDSLPHLRVAYIQGLWVLLTALPVFAANANVVARDVVPLGPLDIAGFTIWAIGFGIEVISDKQKSWFNADPMNKGHWIDVGLWKYSRHPNCKRPPSPLHLSSSQARHDLAFRQDLDEI